MFSHSLMGIPNTCTNIRCKAWQMPLIRLVPNARAPRKGENKHTCPGRPLPMTETLTSPPPSSSFSSIWTVNRCQPGMAATVGVRPLHTLWEAASAQIFLKSVEFAEGEREADLCLTLLSPVSWLLSTTVQVLMTFSFSGEDSLAFSWDVPMLCCPFV